MPNGERPIRPYANIVHDHFTNYQVNGEDLAVANLPGFDIPAKLIDLHGYRIDLQIRSVYELASPVPTGGSDPIAWQRLAAPRALSIVLNDQRVSSLELPAGLTLSAAVPPEGILDLDPLYQLNAASESFLLVVLTLATTAPNVEPSAPIRVVLAPPGHRHHATALALEQRLATEGIAP